MTSQFSPSSPANRQVCQPGRVSFPIIAEPLPDRQLFADPAGFASVAGQHGRDWIFHAQIQQAAAGTRSGWEGIEAPQTLRKLIPLLQLRDSYRVVPLEFLPGREPEPKNRSPWVFTQPPELTGSSMELALAVGLLSAQQQRGIPPWLLLSGTLNGKHCPQTQSPLLGSVASLKRKIKLALGIGEGNGQIAGLLGEFYSSAASTYLGPQEERTVPGQVRLFLTPQRIDVSDLGELQTTCRVRQFRLSAAQIRQAFRQGPPRTIGELAEATGLQLPEHWAAGCQDWLLLVQVRTLAQSLRIQGLRSPWRCSQRPLLCHLILPRRTSTGHLLRDEDDWSNRERVLQEYLEQQLQRCAGQHEKLSLLLRVYLDEVSRQPGLERACFCCAVGEVSKDGKLLRTRQSISSVHSDPALSDTRNIFPFYPADRGPTCLALREKRAIVAPHVQEDSSIKKAFEWEVTEFVSKYHLPQERVPAQKRFLNNMRSYICVPVIDRARPEPIGTISLLLDRPIHPDQVPHDLLKMFENLAQFAVAPLQVYATQEEPFPQDTEAASHRQSSLYAGEEYLTARANLDGALSELRNTHARELARQVCQLSPSIYRAAVRWLDPEGTLSVVGYQGDFEPEWLRQPIAVTGVPLDELCSTGGYAIQTRRDIFVDDTDYLFDVEGRKIPHRPVRPAAQAHAAVLLSFGGQILGVLSVDFQTKFIPEATRTVLKNLAGQYALLFKACRIDDEFSRLERQDLTPVFCLERGPAWSEPSTACCICVIGTAACMCCGPVLDTRPGGKRTGRKFLARDSPRDRGWRDGWSRRTSPSAWPMPGTPRNCSWRQEMPKVRSGFTGISPNAMWDPSRWLTWVFRLLSTVPKFMA